MVCPLVREIIHSLKPVDYFLVQAHKSWYNYSVLRRLQNLQNLGLDLAYNFKIKTNIWTVEPLISYEYEISDKLSVM